MEENNELKELSNQLNDSLDQLNLDAVKIRERKAAAIRDAAWWKHSQELMEDIFKNPDRTPSDEIILSDDWLLKVKHSAQEFASASNIFQAAKGALYPAGKRQGYGKNPATHDFVLAHSAMKAAAHSLKNFAQDYDCACFPEDYAPFAEKIKKNGILQTFWRFLTRRSRYDYEFNLLAKCDRRALEALAFQKKYSPIAHSLGAFAILLIVAAFLLYFLFPVFVLALAGICWYDLRRKPVAVRIGITVLAVAFSALWFVFFASASETSSMPEESAAMEESVPE